MNMGAQAIETVTKPDTRRPRRNRGEGSIYRPRYRDRKTRESRQCRTFWIQYYRNGIAIRENTHSDKITIAREILKKRMGEMATGSWVEPRAQKVMMPELVDALLREYRNNQRKSLDIVEHKWKKHLEPFFGTMRAVDVSTDAIDRYIEQRKTKAAENATINRELAILRRAFFLAYRSRPRKVYEVPPFPRLEENAPRDGFVDDAQYSALAKCCEHLWLRTMLAVAYSFGFRKAELLNLRVRQVDLLNRTLTLDPGTTKNKQGRIVKLTTDTFNLLSACVLRKSDDDFVFTWPYGSPVRDFRAMWEKVIKAANLPGLLFHDLRRSAVRNMIRRGIPQVVAMRISGHKTTAVFNRYNIVSESDLEDAARRIESHGKADDFARTVSIPSQNVQTPAN